MKTVSELYGLYPGSDIYVVGTGASLRVFPPSFFEGKILLGLNDAYRLAPVRYCVTVHPDLYVPEFLAEGSNLRPDLVWITKFEKTRDLVTPEQFRHAEKNFYFFESKGRANSQPPQEPNDEGRRLEWVRRPEGNFLYQWSSIAQTAANLAANLGARNVILVGCDCTSLNGNDHAHAKPTRWKGVEPAARYRQYYEGLAEVRSALRQRGVNLVSLTPFAGLEDPSGDFERLCSELDRPPALRSLGDRSPRPALSENLRWARQKMFRSIGGFFKTTAQKRKQSPSSSFGNTAPSPTPILKNSSKVFCIGSCFAMEIKAVLRELNFTVHPSADIANASLPDGRPAETAERTLVHYNTFTILQEFEKAFGLWSQGEEDVWHFFVEKKNFPTVGMFQDPYRRKVFAGSKEELFKIIHSTDAAIRRGILESDVYIITLGLTEVWKKKNDGRIACANPGYGRGTGWEETLFVRSTFQENYANIKALVELVQSKFPDRPIVLTVSPVPLGQTFTDQEVFTANMESKSILRAVAGQITREYPSVHYFPAFEMCAKLERQGKEKVYMPDGRHVEPAVVKKILDQFLKRYWIPEDTAKPKKINLLYR